MATHVRCLVRLVVVCAAAACLAATAGAESQAPSVLVFAAASLQTAIDELSPAITKATGVTVKASYAASSALAKQIENGAPADIFMSADLDWMDYLAERRLIRQESRINLLGNDLVLVAPANRKITMAIGPNFGLAAALGADRLAVADPAAVPAGKYAKDALTRLGVWDSVSGKLAPAENVRAALLLVSRGETPLGIVYRTDALADTGVAIVGQFPNSSHAPIIYPAALTSTSGAGADKALAFLSGTAARQVFERLGFRVIAK
jgi:molybdate transport system substrate-binding protein